MKDAALYTITILRNYGRPVSLTLKGRTLVAGIAGLLLALAMVLFGAVDYIMLNLEVHHLNNQLEDTNSKLAVLDKHVQEMDAARFRQGQPAADEPTDLQAKLLAQQPFSAEGLWISGPAEGGPEVKREGLSVEIASTEVDLNGETLEFDVTLHNTSNPAVEVGGYLCLTLVNQDVFPVVYKSISAGALGEDGFPVSYKSGEQYFVGPDKERKVKLTYKLTAKDEYWTHVAVFGFSYKGTLLSKKTIPLQREIFFE